MDIALPIIERKIRPRRPPKMFCQRPRLVDLIHRYVDRKLIILSAGAGYGKTTLLTEFCQDTDLPVCWYTLDPYDARLATFVTYLVAAIRAQFPDFAQGLDLSRALGDIEMLARLLIHAIEQVDHYFILVLDDYHEVNESVAVNSLMDLLLSYLPENCHILLASRGTPARLSTSRLAARQESFSLYDQDLAFNREEMRRLLTQLGHTEITETELDNLVQRSEGWVTGVLLAAQMELSSSAQNILRLTGYGHAVFSYLAAEVLQQQPPAVQSFLLGSSILDEMTPATCNALLSISDSAEILASLTRQALFTFPTGGGRSFVYHQLFREFLRSQLIKDSTRFRELGLRAGELLAAEGDWATAIEQYLQAEAYPQAIDLLEMAAEQAFDGGYREELATWIDDLPADLLAQHPRLLFYRAKGYTESGDWSAAIELLRRVQVIGVSTGDVAITARALVQRAVVERLQLNLAAAVHSCQQALEVAPPDDAWVRLRALHNRGICRLMQSDDGGLADLREALGIARNEGDDTNAAYIAHDLGNTLVRHGRLQEAQASFHQALMHWRKAGNASDVALTLQGLGVISHHLGEYAEAEARLSDSLLKAEESNDQRLQAYAHANLAELFRDLSRYEEAQTHAQRALDLAGRAKAQDLMVSVGVLQADILRLQGEGRLARQFAQEALDQAIASELSYETALARSALAMAMLQQNDAATAIALLQQALPELEEIGAPRDIARTHLQMGLACLQNADQKEAARHLREVQQLIIPLGSVQVLVTEGPTGVDQLEQAQAAGLCTFDLAAVRVLLHRAEDRPPAAPSEAPPDLAFYALDGAQVRVRGELITRWESAVAREMAFLLASNPRGLRRDTIIEMLWPESEPDKGNSLFHSTLYRVRRALGSKVVTRIADRYALEPSMNVSLDAGSFEELARQALSQPDNREARTRALALYHEPYLGACELQWCYQQREQLSHLLGELLLLEAQDCIALGDTHAAEAAFTRLLELDDLDERAYRGVMWCRYTHGDEAGATRAYMQCRQALRRELGIDPEAATRKMWDVIRHHEPLPKP